MVFYCPVVSVPAVGIASVKVEILCAVIEVYVAVQTTVTADSGVHCSVKSIARFLLENDIDDAAHSVWFIFCGRVGDYFNLFDIVCRHLVQGVASRSCPHHCRRFAVDENRYVLIASQSYHAVQIDIYRRYILHQVAC